MPENSKSAKEFKYMHPHYHLWSNVKRQQTYLIYVYDTVLAFVLRQDEKEGDVENGESFRKMRALVAFTHCVD